MRGSGHLKTAAVAALVGAVAATCTVALAGSGINGIMNLGVTNTVDNATTKLSGTNASSMLDVSNTNSASSNANGIVGRSASANATGLAGTNSAPGGVAVKGT